MLKVINYHKSVITRKLCQYAKVRTTFILIIMVLNLGLQVSQIFFEIEEIVVNYVLSDDCYT